MVQTKECQRFIVQIDVTIKETTNRAGKLGRVGVTPPQINSPVPVTQNLQGKKEGQCTPTGEKSASQLKGG